MSFAALRKHYEGTDPSEWHVRGTEEGTETTSFFHLMKFFNRPEEVEPESHRSQYVISFKANWIHSSPPARKSFKLVASPKGSLVFDYIKKLEELRDELEPDWNGHPAATPN